MFNYENMNAGLSSTLHTGKPEGFIINDCDPLCVSLSTGVPRHLFGNFTTVFNVLRL